MPHVSYSQMMTLFGCPEKHRLQYLLEKPTPGLGVAAAMGVAAHGAPEMCLKAVQQGMRMPTKEQVIGKVRQRWRALVSGGIDGDLAGAEDKAAIYAERIYDEVLPLVRKGSKEAEWDFYLPFGVEGWHFKGAVDHLRIVGKEAIIDDWKTTSSPRNWSQSKADKSEQVEAYYWAIWQHFGIVPNKFIFHVVWPEGYKAYETDRPWGLVEAWKDRMEYATRLIGLHSKDKPSDKRVGYEWHATCPWRRECTPWEFGSLGKGVVL